MKATKVGAYPESKKEVKKDLKQEVKGKIAKKVGEYPKRKK